MARRTRVGTDTLHAVHTIPAATPMITWVRWGRIASRISRQPERRD